VNTTDANSAAMHPLDVVKALDQFRAAILSEAFFGADWGV